MTPAEQARLDDARRWGRMIKIAILFLFAFGLTGIVLGAAWIVRRATGAL